MEPSALEIRLGAGQIDLLAFTGWLPDR